MEIGNLADWFSGLATLLASMVALYLGLRRLPQLRVNVQPWNLGVIPGNGLLIVITNLAPETIIINSITVVVKFVIWRGEYTIPKSWHEGVIGPSTLGGHVSSSLVIHPSPITDNVENIDLINRLLDLNLKYANKRVLSLIISIFLRIQIAVYPQNADICFVSIKGEMRRRIRNGLLI